MLPTHARPSLVNSPSSSEKKHAPHNLTNHSDSATLTHNICAAFVNQGRTRAKSPLQKHTCLVARSLRGCPPACPHILTCGKNSGYTRPLLHELAKDSLCREKLKVCSNCSPGMANNSGKGPTRVRTGASVSAQLYKDLKACN